MPPAQPGPSQAIEAVLSTARFRPYLDACASDPQRALELYEWNIAVSAAFWEVIAVAEVAWASFEGTRRYGSSALRAFDPADRQAAVGWRRLDALVDAAESDEELVARVRSGAVGGRVRVVGDECATLPADLAGHDVTVLAQPVLAAAAASCSPCCASRPCRARSTASVTCHRSTADPGTAPAPHMP